MQNDKIVNWLQVRFSKMSLEKKIIFVIINGNDLLRSVFIDFLQVVLMFRYFLNLVYIIIIKDIFGVLILFGS